MAPGKTIKYTGANLYPKQRAAIYDPARLVTIEAGTKCGKTIGCLSWLLEQALLGGSEGRNYWWVAPVFGQAGIGYRRMKMKIPRGLYKANESKLTITLANGAIIWFKSAERPDDLYGEDVYAVVMDEASRMREDAWVAVRSTLTFTRGPVRMIGNVKGKKNFFYLLAREAERGESPDMAHHRITAWDAVEAGVLDRAEIESAYRDLKRLGREGTFNQLYLAEASDDGDNPFGIEAIDMCVVDKLSTEYPKAAGVDVAGRGAQNQAESSEDSIQERDFTAIVMLDKEGYTTHLSRFQMGPADTATEIARVVKGTMALVDSTGAGDAVVEALQRRGTMRVEGFTFTERSRQDLLEGLAVAIGDGTVHFPDGWMRDELDSFEFRYTARGVRWVVPSGYHDDGVMALALAVRKLPKRKGAGRAPLGVPKPAGSAWQTDEAAGGNPLLGGAQTPDTTSPPKTTVPMPIVIGGGGGSRWDM